MVKLVTISGCTTRKTRTKKVTAPCKRAVLSQNPPLAAKFLLFALVNFAEAQHTFEARYSTKVQPQSYTVKDGDYSNTEISLNSSRDTGYSGSLHNQTLSGGLGKLTDGHIATTTTVNESDNVWMRWNTSLLQIDFFFKNPVLLCQINFQLYGEDLNTQIVQVNYGDHPSFIRSTIANADLLNANTVAVTSVVPKVMHHTSEGVNYTTDHIRIIFSINNFFTNHPKPRLLALSEFSFFKCECPPGLHFVPCLSFTVASPCTDLHIDPSEPNICPAYPDAICKNNFCQEDIPNSCVPTYIHNGQPVDCNIRRPTPKTSHIPTSSSPAAGSLSSSSSQKHTGFVIAIIVLGLLFLVVCVVALWRGRYYHRLKQKFQRGVRFNGGGTSFTDYSAQTLSRIFMNKGLSDRDSALTHGSNRTLSFTIGSPEKTAAEPVSAEGYDQPRTKASMYRDVPKKPTAFLALSKKQQSFFQGIGEENMNTGENDANSRNDRYTPLSQHYVPLRSTPETQKGGADNNFTQHGMTLPLGECVPAAEKLNAASDQMYTPMNGRQSFSMSQDNAIVDDLYTPMDGQLPAMLQENAPDDDVYMPMDGQPSVMMPQKSVTDYEMHNPLDGQKPITVRQKNVAVTGDSACMPVNKQRLALKKQNSMTSDV